MTHVRCNVNAYYAYECMHISCKYLMILLVDGMKKSMYSFLYACPDKTVVTMWRATGSTLSLSFFLFQQISTVRKSLDSHCSLYRGKCFEMVTKMVAAE